MAAPLEQRADVCMCISTWRYADSVQELQIKIIHILIELTERAAADELRGRKLAYFQPAAKPRTTGQSLRSSA